MFYVTKIGIRVLGVGLRAPAVPEPNWWAHHSACAWTAAWLTVRERRFLGEPEIRHSGEWAERLQWYDSRGWKRSGHRPDLIAWAPDNTVFAVEVELAQKSKARLGAILKLHNSWMLSDKLCALLYVVGDEAGVRRIRIGMKRHIYLSDRKVRIELLDTIKQQTVDGFGANRARKGIRERTAEARLPSIADTPS